MSTTLSADAQKLMGEIVELGNQGYTFEKAVALAAANMEITDNKGAKLMADAIKQLEEFQARGANKIEELQKRLQKAEARAFGSASQYRGSFASEDAARAFGLMIVGKTLRAEWAQDALKSEHRGLYDTAVENKLFGSASAAAVIPREWSTTMENLLEDHGVFMADTLSMPMGSKEMQFSKKTGRMSAVPMAEATAVAATEPSLDAIELIARKWGAYTEVSSEASDDSIIAIAEFIASDMAEAHALAMDEAGFLGDGSATYNQITGVVNALGAGAIQAAGSNAWGGYDYDTFGEGIGRVVPKTFSGAGAAKWYGSHRFFWQVLAPLQLAAGGNVIASVAAGPQMQFMGSPYQVTQVLPSTPAGDQIPLIFGNLRRGTVMGNRRQLEIKASEHFRFASDQTAMLSTYRYDINVHGGGNATKAETLVGFRTAA